MLADTLVCLGLAVLPLGTIREGDGVVERTFWLRNAGADTLALRQGYTSCGCTTVAFPRDTPIAPGDSVSVTLSFNPRGKGGDFYENATLVYATPRETDPRRRKRLNLALEGTCQTSEETLLRMFPVRLTDALRLSADRFDLGRLRPGETRERNIVVLHRDDHDRQERLTLRFSPAPDTPKGLQHIKQSLTTDNGQTVTVTLDVFVL